MTLTESDAPVESSFWSGGQYQTLTAEEHLKLYKCYSCGYCAMPDCQDHTRVCLCDQINLTSSAYLRRANARIRGEKHRYKWTRN